MSVKAPDLKIALGKTQGRSSLLIVSISVIKQTAEVCAELGLSKTQG